MRLRIPCLVGAALAVGAIGCGGDATPDERPIDVVSRYLPAASPGVVVFADLAAARDQLGLPPDADALHFQLLAEEDYDPDSPRARLLQAARAGIPALPLSGRTLQPGAVAAALDGTAITAAATGSGKGAPRGTLIAIRTSQPLDELAGALEKEGYERDGNVVSKPGAQVNEIADAGDGVFVLSTGEASADAIADPGGGPAAALALLRPADGVVADGIAGLPDDCVTGYGGWEDARSASGVFRVATAGPADVERVELHRFEAFTDVTLGAPSAEGNAFEVPFTGGGEAGASPVRDLISGSLGRGLYDCD
jgi:hypothetical protein